MYMYSDFQDLYRYRYMIDTHHIYSIYIYSIQYMRNIYIYISIIEITGPGALTGDSISGGHGENKLPVEAVPKQTQGTQDSSRLWIFMREDP